MVEQLFPAAEPRGNHEAHRTSMGQMVEAGLAIRYLFQRVFVAIILRNMAIPEDKRIE